MSELDEILQRKLEALEEGASPRRVVKGLKGEATELEPLIILAANIRDLPQPELSPEASHLMQKELITTARETLKLPSHKPAFSLARLFSPGFASLSLVILLLAVVFFGGRAWLAGPSAAHAVRLMNVTGQVEVAENARAGWQAAVVGTGLHSGQLVRTQANSSAVLQYFDGTQTVMASNTELKLEEINGGWGGVLKVSLAQSYGLTNHQVVPFGDRKSSFAVNTSAGSASVHGTNFSAASEPSGKAVFAVETGQVVVENDMGQVTLSPGQATAIQVDQAPEAPVYTFSLTDTLVLADGNTWWIGGVPFTITPDTLLLDKFQPGDTVLVTGRILEDGTWVIDSIQPAQASSKKSTFAGVVQQMNDDNWLISGISVMVNVATRILDDVQLGNVVKVKYVVLENGSWQALEISTLVAGKLLPTPDATSTSPPLPTETLPPSGLVFVGSSEPVDCVSVENQPEAARLAELYHVPIAEIMGWFCKGFGFGEIEQVYALHVENGLSPGEIFASRSSGQGLGEIKQDNGSLPAAAQNQSANSDNSANANKSPNAKVPEKDPKPTKPAKP
jgi:hypothetical protein